MNNEDDLDKLMDKAIQDAPEKIQQIDELEDDVIEIEPEFQISIDDIVFEDPAAISDDVNDKNVNDVPKQPMIMMSRLAMQRAKARRTIIFLPK